jgi:YVTN family beta-propeller protein
VHLGVGPFYKKEMRRHLCAPLLGALAGACGALEAAGPATSTPIPPITVDAVFVVNQAESSITVIDAERLEVIGVIALENAPAPFRISLSPDGRSLAVAVPGVDGESAQGEMPAAVMVLDASTGDTRVSVRLPASNRNALFAPDGQTIWTSQSQLSQVILLDSTTLQTFHAIDVGEGPSEVTFSPDGRYAFVANTQSDSVSIMDTTSCTVFITLPVGERPVAAWPGPGRRMYVANEGSHSLSVLDLDSLMITATYSLGFPPAMVGSAPTGELWVASPPDGRIVLLDPDSGQAIDEVQAGAGAHAFAFAADAEVAFVSNREAGTVTAVEVASRQTLETIQVGGQPSGLVVVPLR